MATDNAPKGRRERKELGTNTNPWASNLSTGTGTIAGATIDFDKKSGWDKEESEPVATKPGRKREETKTEEQPQQRKNKHFEDDNTGDIPEIPDLEEEPSDQNIQSSIASAPLTAVKKVQSISELEQDIKFALPTSTDSGLDLSVLASALSPQESVDEGKDVWEFESLLVKVSQEIEDEKEKKEEKEEEKTHLKNTINMASFLPSVPSVLHKPTIKQIDFFLPDDLPAPPRRENLNLISPKSRCFLINNMLSAEHCQHLVMKAEEAGFEGVEWEYTPDYRKCDRIVSYSQEFSNYLWSRILLCMNRADIENVRPFGFGNEGIWKPIGVNECIRITRYTQDGHFKPHRDGGFVRQDNERSVYTVLIYLNEPPAFEGGNTVFEEEFPGHLRSVKPADRSHIHQIEPRIGTAVLFTHDMIHQGRKVTEGLKYILRTDIIFTRLNVSPINQALQSETYLQNPLFQQAHRLYIESIELQNAGDASGSTLKYLEAMEIQAQLASVEDSNPPDIQNDWLLSFDCSVVVFSFLTPREVFSCLQVSKGWNSAASSSELWKILFERRWPEHLLQEIMSRRGNGEIPTPLCINPISCKSILIDHSNLIHKPDSSGHVGQSSWCGLVPLYTRLNEVEKLSGILWSQLSEKLAGSANIENVDDGLMNWDVIDVTANIQSSNIEDPVVKKSELYLDWMSLFREKFFRESKCQVFYVDVGGWKTKFGILGSNVLSYPRCDSDGYRRRAHIDCDDLPEESHISIGQVRSIVSRMRGHYWSAGSGINQFIVGEHEIKTQFSYDISYFQNLFFAREMTHWASSDETHVPRSVVDPLVVEVILNWISLRMFRKNIKLSNHPLLLAVPPTISKENINDIHQTLRKIGVQEVALIPSPLLTLFHHGFSSGIVVDGGYDCVRISAIIGGKILELPTELRVWRKAGKDVNSMVEEFVKREVASLPNSENREYLAKFFEQRDSFLKRIRDGEFDGTELKARLESLFFDSLTSSSDSKEETASETQTLSVSPTNEANCSSLTELIAKVVLYVSMMGHSLKRLKRFVSHSENMHWRAEDAYEASERVLLTGGCSYLFASRVNAELNRAVAIEQTHISHDRSITVSVLQGHCQDSSDGPEFDVIQGARSLAGFLQYYKVENSGVFDVDILFPEFFNTEPSQIDILKSMTEFFK